MRLKNFTLRIYCEPSYKRIVETGLRLIGLRCIEKRAIFSLIVTEIQSHVDVYVDLFY